MTTAVWVLLAGLACGGVYGYSLVRHPWGRPCSHCNGTGRHAGTTWDYAYGHCRWCKGRPQKPRLGVRVLMPGTYQRMRAGLHGRWY